MSRSSGIGASVMDRDYIQQLREESATWRSRAERLQEELAEVRSKTEEKVRALAEGVDAKLHESKVQDRTYMSLLLRRMTRTAVLEQLVHAEQREKVRCQEQLLQTCLEKERCKQRLHDILRSRSWRLTAPLRSLSTAIRRLVGLANNSG